MPSITSTGVGSGLDVSSIVSQLMAIESRPLTLLQQAQSDLNTKLSAFGKLQSLTSSMRDAAGSVTSLLLWKQTTATSSDSASVGVSTAGGAVAGSYNVSVQTLARGQTISSRALPASDSTLGEGTLTIELGSWASDGTTTAFTPKSDTSPVSITIGAGDTSLATIRDRINAAGAGVSASIVNDASGARLALRSSATGAENAFRITASETVDDGDPNAGLSALGYDAAAGASPMTLNQTAVNAQATINGITVSSASNTLDGVSDGLTLNLLKTTTGDVEIDVRNDDDAVKSAINNFVKAFNDLAGNLREQTKYDADSKSAGTLQGDRTAVGLLNRLRGVINKPCTASSSFSMLADIGITLQANGTLAVNDTRLGAALADRGELKKLLTADTGSDEGTGFMARFRKLGDTLLGTDGALETHAESLQSMIRSNSNSQDAMQRRLTQTEARMRAQYQALDTNMAQLSGLSNYLTGQLAALNKSA